MDLTFFETYGAGALHPDTFDSEIGSAGNQGRLICVFFWGHDCPNCEIAKKTLLDRRAEAMDLRLKWYHVNVYRDFDLATRFGLFGIPVFIFFRDGRKLGRISPFPGFEAFRDAVVGLG